MPTKEKFEGVVIYYMISESIFNAAEAHEKNILDWIYFRFWKETWGTRPFSYRCNGSDYFTFQSQFSAN